MSQRRRTTSSTDAHAPTTRELADAIATAAAAELGTARPAAPGIDTVLRARVISACLMVASRHAMMIGMHITVLEKALVEAYDEELKLQAQRRTN